MGRQTLHFFCWIFYIQMGCASSQPPSQVPEVLKTKPFIENKEFTSMIPIETWENKIFLTAEVNGKSYRFILDTGSPTILTKKVAEELGLEIKGQNTGKDANGNLVTMNLSVLDRLTIGEVSFRNIPVFIFDSSQLEAGKCFLDGGIIGSEIMPLGTWQINFPKQEIILTNESHQLQYIEGAKQAKVKVFQYPFYPILEYKINGEFIDNAMFDTGNTELLHLNNLAFEELTKRQLIPLSTKKAFGAFGESAGGRGKEETFSLVPLKQLSIGEILFQNIQVWTRSGVPSLVGAKILESHVVTIDYSNEAIYFYQYQEPKLEIDSFGFKPYLKNQSVYIGWVSESSPAAKAGLQVHDQILQINNKNLRDIPASEQCSILKGFPTVMLMEKIEIIVKSNEIIKQVVLEKQ